MTPKSQKTIRFGRLLALFTFITTSFERRSAIDLASTTVWESGFHRLTVRDRTIPSPVKKEPEIKKTHPPTILLSLEQLCPRSPMLLSRPSLRAFSSLVSLRQTAQYSAVLTRKFHHHSPLFDTRKSPLKLPTLPNKDYLIHKLHKDTKLPFNITRDVIGIPIYDRIEQDYCHQAWLDYCTLHDVDILRDEINNGTSAEEFWIKSLKIVIQTPHFLPPLSKLMEDPETSKALGIPEDYPEKLVVLLCYHEKFDYAKMLVERFFGNEQNVNWRLLLHSALVFDSELPMDILTSIYLKSSKKDRAYSEIMQSLRDLKLKEVFLNRFSNRIILLGGLGDLKSDSINPDLESKLDILNMKSFTMVLQILSNCPKPKDWLKESTSLLFARYITLCAEKDRERRLRDMLSRFKDQNFHKSFWLHLYKNSKIDMKVLDLLSQTSSELRKPSKSTREDLVKFKAKGFVESNDQQGFWTFIAEESKGDDKLLMKVSPEMLIMKIRKSNNLNESLEFAKTIILSSNNLKRRQSIIKSFIIETTDVILAKRLFHHNKVISRFETFLDEEKLMNSQIDNYFIYHELKLLKFKKALNRLDRLMSLPVPSITAQTIDSSVSALFRHVKLLKEQGVFETDTENAQRIESQILELIFKCPSHCFTEFKPITWGRILNNVVESFPLEETKPFLIRIKDFIVDSNKSMKNIHPCNETHPLRIAFSDLLIRKIIHRGFVSPGENPWVGFELVRELESMGVYVSEKVLKGHLIKYVRIYHGLPKTKKKWRSGSRWKGKPDHRDGPLNDIESTVSSLNEIYAT